jgi:hypothetical protein
VAARAVRRLSSTEVKQLYNALASRLSNAPLHSQLKPLQEQIARTFRER